MKKFLVVYATVEGQTEKIARFVADELKKSGHSVHLIDTSHQIPTVNVAEYDALVVGGPVHYSGYPYRLKRWVKGNAWELSLKPGAFFSVCLGVRQYDDVKAQAEVRKVVREFFTQCHWHPQTWIIFAGALAYSKYGWLKRFIMREIARKAGGDADTRRDHDYTDWEEVRRFTHDFESLVVASDSLQAIS